ncbi:NAD(P)-dependent oxidoreductase [Salinicola aestuarinus]|uniref:NAD(P)-dependent oxidoreductase n=1 Tax=Salinicola aestuarinus TaxID=1949082 RepID=UPI000DA2076A|nr:NAD(P)-dependent oxidoreductase [Salinicola aestuarinus]
MGKADTIVGVYLSDSIDLEAIYGESLRAEAGDVVLRHPSQIQCPEEVRFAICWLPVDDAFAPYPNLQLAMSIGAGVDALMSHPGLDESVRIARVRDPHQADLMAGFAAHEVLHHEREFDRLRRQAERATWHPLPMRAPASRRVAILGHGTMGRAVARALAALGFDVRVACSRAPQAPVNGVHYETGPGAVEAAATDADYLINVLPLTAQTDNILSTALFARLRPGAWLIQIGRGEHLVEEDLLAALAEGSLAGASLDVFRDEPLGADHPFWSHPKLRLSPHIASDSLPEVVSQQVIESARALRDGGDLALAVDRARGY